MRKRTAQEADLDDSQLTTSTPRFDIDQGSPSVPSSYPNPTFSQTGPDHAYPLVPLRASPSPGVFLDPALRGADMGATRESSTGSGNIAFNDMQNPSDALGILAQIASSNSDSVAMLAAANSKLVSSQAP